MNVVGHLLVEVAGVLRERLSPSAEGEEKETKRDGIIPGRALPHNEVPERPFGSALCGSDVPRDPLDHGGSIRPRPDRPLRGGRGAPFLLPPS